MSVNVSCKEERVFLKEKDGYLWGSILLRGGKDAKGNYLPNGFMNVRFSYDVQDAIYEAIEDFKSATMPNEIKCDVKGFLVWNEYKDIKEPVLVVTAITNIEEYIKEEKPFTKTRRGSK